ncbi:MAG: sulfocyanin-like copper-binding protein [bacterium]
MIRFRSIAVLGVLASFSLSAVFTAACGGSSGNDKVDISNVTVDAGKETTNTTEAIIEVHDNSFTPDTITIKSGTKVVWKWVGTANMHSIQLAGQTSTQQSSGTFERVFAQGSGTFSYQCGVHGAAMSGKILVE